MRRLIAILLILVFVVIGLSFAALNPEPVEVKYYLGEAQAPLALVVVIALAVGALFGVLASMGVVVNQRRQIGGLRRKMGVQEREIHNLREIPLKDRH